MECYRIECSISIEDGILFLTGLEPYHLPVMVPEVMNLLNVKPGGRYIDATCGEGGHTRAILRACQPGGSVMGLDADHEALSVATERLKEFGGAFATVNTNFRNIRSVAIENDFVPLHGVLFDLGMSSFQLEGESRGFSFARTDPLDMRFSVTQKLTAAKIVNSFTEGEIASIIYHFGEDTAARRIAKAIVKNRPVSTSAELAKIVEKANPRRSGNSKHPATRTFQAIRIAVNNELTALEIALEQAVSILGPEGRIVVISYHSLEDRIVKDFIRRESSDCICPPGTPICICEHRATLKKLTRRPLKPTSAEVKVNIRSRSANLRAAERV